MVAIKTPNPSNRDIYDKVAFVRLVGSMRKSGATLAEVIVTAKAQFGYPSSCNALRNWWKAEGNDRYEALFADPKGAGKIEDFRHMVNAFSHRYNGWLKLSGNFLVTSDWHIPHFNPDLAEKAMVMSKNWGLRQHCIAGDFLNMTAFGFWDRRDLTDTWQTEKAMASAVLHDVLPRFDQTYWLLGNHEARLLRKLSYEMSENDIANLLVTETVDKQRLKCSPYRYAVINDEWRVTHPKTYSREGAKVPKKLAGKFNQSVLGAHGHHFGIGVAENNLHVGIDLGGMFDVERMEYVMLEDSTHPMWNGGFVIIYNNVAYPFTDNPLLTDWDFWLNTGPPKGKPQKKGAKRARVET